MNSLIKNSGMSPIASIFDEFMSRDLMDWSDKNFSAIGSSLPSANLKETDNKIEVELAAPGMKKNDFNVEIENHMLTISSEKKEEKEKKRKKDNYYRKEFNYQSFSRSFSLPDYADENSVKANYKDGILDIDIAKKEAPQKSAAKKIAIS